MGSTAYSLGSLQFKKCQSDESNVRIRSDFVPMAENKHNANSERRNDDGTAIVFQKQFRSARRQNTY